LFSGSATAGIFSPDDYYECVFKNMRNVENTFAATNSNKSCADKFPGKRKKGNSGLFGPKNKNDCFLKYSNGSVFWGQASHRSPLPQKLVFGANVGPQGAEVNTTQVPIVR